MAHRMGRQYARETFPEPRFTGLVGPFASNFAIATAIQTPVAATPGTQVPWFQIASGAPDGVDVPITPLATGQVQVRVVITLKNSGQAPVTVQGLITVNGVASLVPFLSVVNIGDNDQIVMEMEFARTVGVVTNFGVLLVAGEADAVDINVASSSIKLQEVALATG